MSVSRDRGHHGKLPHNDSLSDPADAAAAIPSLDVLSTFGSTFSWVLLVLLNDYARPGLAFSTGQRPCRLMAARSTNCTLTHTAASAVASLSGSKAAGQC